MGDLNGDAFSDLLVGAYNNDTGGEQAGATYLVFGAVGGSLDLADSDATFVGASEGDEAGISLAVGDTDGDAYMDLFIGAVGVSTGGEMAGGAFLVRGSGI